MAIQKDHLILEPLRKILTSIIPIKSAVKAQTKIMALTTAQTEKFKDIMKHNPSGGVTLTFDAKTGQVIHMEKAR